MEDAQFLRDLYEILQQNSAETYGDIIQNKASYPYLYHLSEIRQNLIDWLPLSKEMHVLERNPECGALTAKLLEKAGQVTCIVEDEMQGNVIRARCKVGTRENVTVNAKAAKGLILSQAEQWMVEGTYDVILIVGSFYRYVEELPMLRSLLKKDGKLIVADANRLGLKYMAGCQEEYQGGYFTGVEGYVTEASGDEQSTGEKLGVQGRCYTRQEYSRLLNTAGFEKLTFYYPYPDHKFPCCIYSDNWLPCKGELVENRRNFERDRVELFDESKVYDTLLGEGLFGEFANSFLIEASQ